MPERKKPTQPTRHRVALMLTAIVAATISVLTLAPIAAPEVVGSGSDKLYHLVAFAALTFPSALLARRISGPILLLALFFGAAIEIVQPSVGRSGEFGDFLADAAGALIGWSAGLLATRFLSN